MTIFVFFRYFFRIFGAPRWVGGFVFFFRNFFIFLGFRGFWALYQARGIVNLVRSIFGTSGSGRDSRNPPLPSSLWHFAIAIFHDIIVNLTCITCKILLPRCLACREQIGMMALCRQPTSPFSLDVTNSRRDSDESIEATCTSPRLDFSHLRFRLGSEKPTFTVICDNHDPTNCGGRGSDMGI